MTGTASLVSLNIDEPLERILRGLRTGAPRFQVAGPVGSGKTTLAHALEEKANAVVVEAPELHEDDAVVHALLQASRRADAAVDGRRSVRDNVRVIADALAAAGRPVVLRLPASWRLDRKPRHAHQQRLLKAARDFIEAWFDHQRLGVVLVADQPRGMPRGQVVRLDPGQTRPEILEAGEVWGAYADAARHLRRSMGIGWNAPSPVTLRLAVGLVALGDSSDAVAQRLFLNQPPGSYVPDLVGRAGNAGLTAPLRRFAEVRSPVPSSWILDVIGCPEEHLPLFTHCLGYGDENTRISASVRSIVRNRLTNFLLPTQDREQTHRRLADQYESIDGVTDPAQSSAEGILYWLEKVHHLAHGGEACAARWSGQVLEHRDHLCERARVLSHVENRYEEAAALYRRVVSDIDDKDAYAWHYLAYNLDKAAADRRHAEDAFRRAIHLDPKNPWWNGRYVTFLIHQARIADADAAWEHAMAQIDPEGDATEHEPELALNLHRWAAREWLRIGEVKRARRVLNRLLQPALSLPEIRAIDHRVRDAEEALSLGASVRPPDMPIERRWISGLPQEDDEGRPLERWFAGRVEAVDEEGVHLVFATTEADARVRRLLRKVMLPDPWRDTSNIPLRSATGQFVEIGEYGAHLLIEPVTTYTQGADGLHDDDLRYLERWAAE